MTSNRGVRRCAMAATFVAALAVPGTARANSIDITSSLSAYCIASVCTTMQFAVDLPSSAMWVDRIQIYNNSDVGWGAIWGATDQSGNSPLVYGLAGNELDQDAPGITGDSPGFLTVAMWNLGIQTEPIVQGGTGLGDGTTPSNPDGGSSGLVDSGSGLPTSSDASNLGLTDPGYGTTATPEPATMLLMGTGLIGVGIARRRRAARSEG